MQQTNVPFKVALGYIIVAIVLILAIGLVYRNTTTVLAINQATRDYIEKRQAADSTMSNPVSYTHLTLPTTIRV